MPDSDQNPSSPSHAHWLGDHVLAPGTIVGHNGIDALVQFRTDSSGGCQRREAYVRPTDLVAAARHLPTPPAPDLRDDPLEEARALHRKYGGQCGTCVDEDGNPQDWPCDTRRALDAVAPMSAPCAPPPGPESVAAAETARWRAGRDVPEHLYRDEVPVATMPAHVVAEIVAAMRGALRPSVLGDIAAERARQDAKWGEQNHPDGTGPGTMPLLPALSEVSVIQDLQLLSAQLLADAATEATDVAARAGLVTWRDILLEEVFEALAEEDSEKLRVELVQTAAVLTQWVEALDRRAGGAA